MFICIWYPASLSLRIDIAVEQDGDWGQPQYPTLQSQDEYGNNLIYNPNSNYVNLDGSSPGSGSTAAPGGLNYAPNNGRDPYLDNKE